MSRRMTSRGFSLIELMIASAVALAAIAGAVSAGIYLQRRGLLEERTMEMQNAARGARELVASDIQRAGAGFGDALLDVAGSGGGVDQRYAVWAQREAAFSSDSTFALPSGAYADLKSDALEVWEADAAHLMRLVACSGSPSGTLCTEAPPGADADGGLPAGTALVVATPNAREACVGRVGSARDLTLPLPYSISWTAGATGLPALPASHFCNNPLNNLTDGGAPAFSGSSLAGDTFAMPLTARAYRVNWKSGAPVLEMDPDGSLGPQPYQALSTEIERLQVRLGVTDPSNPSLVPTFFPDDAGRPSVDGCTNSTCWSLIPDGGTMSGSPPETGLGSARDELMRRVRVVEVRITARLRQPDRDSIIKAGDGGVERDDEGNMADGYKRRHFVIQIAPRNFGIAGG